MYTIEVMKPEDFAAVYDLWLSVKGMGLNNLDDTEEGFAVFLRRNPSTCFKASEDGVMCGVIMAGHDGRRGCLYHVCVDPDYRLRGIGKVEDDEEALRILSERATSPDFFDNIISEYKKDGQMSNFIKIIQCMGNLKRTSYARFGKADKEYLKNQKKYLLDFKEIAESLRDYREPLPDGDSR